MGVERTIAFLQGKETVYDTELFQPIIAAITDITGGRYPSNTETDRAIRIIADHIKAAVFILGDENSVTPSNLGQGYILRRLIRRAIRYARKLGAPEVFLRKPALSVVDIYKDVYPELQHTWEQIIDELTQEESRFMETLQKGEQEFEKLLPNLQKNPANVIPGRIAFRLYDTYGFPLEITEELAAENGLSVDKEGFEKAFKKHQEISKQGAEKTFKGGLADQSRQTTRLHTATHLLHKALRMVLGDHVQQKGSNITPKRLRFDFSHPEKMTREELDKVEEIVNTQIELDLPVTMEMMSLEEARKQGALAFFGDRYEEQVKVYSVGDFSKEVCGGPHVNRTGEVGRFSITKEQSSSAGVRRIRAVLESPE